MTLDKRDRTLVLMAIACAIDKENRALEVCAQEIHDGFLSVNSALTARRHLLTQFQELRQRLMRTQPVPKN
jgi:hypothetical protein